MGRVCTCSEFHLERKHLGGSIIGDLHASCLQIHTMRHQCIGLRPRVQKEPHQQSTSFMCTLDSPLTPYLQALELLEYAPTKVDSVPAAGVQCTLETTPVPRLAWSGRFIVAKIPELYRFDDSSIVGEWEVLLDCLGLHDLV